MSGVRPPALPLFAQSSTLTRPSSLIERSLRCLSSLGDRGSLGVGRYLQRCGAARLLEASPTREHYDVAAVEAPALGGRRHLT